MKKSIKLLVLQLVWVALCFALFSFSTMPGGDSYEIYLGNKLMIQQRVYLQKEVPTFSIAPGMNQEMLSITYDHCGRAGTARTISIRDTRDEVLKEWHFADAADGTKAPMVLKVNDLVGFDHGRGTILKLYYSSKELPTRRMLASVQVDKDSNTALNR